MAQKSKLLGSGMAAQAANYIVGDAATGLTATGSSQATALPLNDVNGFTTVASSTGAVLPASATPGDTITVYNTGAQSLSVYPPGSESINQLSPAGAFTLAANKCALFTKVGPSLWASILTA